MSREDLRARSVRLRDHSRELVARSRDCRQRMQAAALAVTERVGPSAASAGADVERLRRAESDLETAISECTAALTAIRRELGWRDDGETATVH